MEIWFVLVGLFGAADLVGLEILLLEIFGWVSYLVESEDILVGLGWGSGWASLGWEGVLVGLGWIFLGWRFGWVGELAGLVIWWYFTFCLI